MQATATTTLLVADDHPLIRRGLAEAIDGTDDFDLLATAGDGEEALRLIRELAPDVSLLDLDMPRLDGWDLLARVKDESLPTRVIALAKAHQERLVYAAVKAGAKGFLLKTTPWPSIAKAIRQAAEGEMPIDPAATTAFLSAIFSDPLTERERAVLTLTGQHLTAKEVGSRLHLSERSVKKHLTAIYTKLGVTSKAEALMVALRVGLIR